MIHISPSMLLYHDDMLTVRKYQLVQSSLVEPRAIVIDGERRVVVFGDVAHYSWQMQMAYLNQQTRRRVDEMLADLARRNGVETLARS